MTTKAKVTIVPETIKLSVTGDACNLSLPRVHRSKSNIAPGRRVYDSHARFRFQAEPRAGVAIEKLRKRADLEVAAIFSTFPDVSETNTVLAMAAWFYLLYTVDDLIEEMRDPAMAVEALKKSSTIFSSRSTRDKRSIPADQVLSNGPLPSKHHADYQDLLPTAVAYACRAFRDYVRLLMSEHTYQRLIFAIAEVWTGMISEIHFRRQRRSSVAPYMAIRVRTIGLAPFFVLLRRNGGREDPWSNSQKDEHTTNLETCVKTAVGIQNDLVGLAKDLKEGEHMNWVLLGLAKMDLSSSGCESGSESDRSTDTESLDVVNEIIRPGAERAVAVHNLEVERAYIHLEKMQDKEYGLMLIGFIERHLRWAQMTARYKLAAAKMPEGP